MGCSNNNLDFEIKVAFKVRNNHNKDPIVKLGLVTTHWNLVHISYPHDHALSFL
jgi:hypothetical protein